MQQQALAISVLTSAELFAAAATTSSSKQVKFDKITRQRNSSNSTRRNGNCAFFFNFNCFLLSLKEILAFVYFCMSS